MSDFVNGFVRPFTEWSFAHRSKTIWKIPKPDGAPTAHASGPDPDRILLLGSGPAAGFGVRSHDLALPGHLAREVSAQTDRGVTVDYVGHAGARADEILGTIDQVSLWRYDSIVVALGNGEAVHLTPLDDWSANITGVVEKLLAATETTTRIVLMGIPPIGMLPIFQGAPGRFADRYAPTLDRVQRELADRFERVHYVSLTPQDCESRRHRTSSDYRLWAGQIAALVVPGLEAPGEVPSTVRTGDTDFPELRSEARLRSETLDRVRLDLRAEERPGLGTADLARGPDDGLTARLRRAGAQDEEARLAAVRGLALDLDELPEVAKIVETVRSLFGTAAAAFTVVDRDVQINRVRVGFGAPTTPRSSSMCSLVIQEEGALVVADITRDPRFAGDGKTRFYAGYPVESPDGFRIGALCIFDSEVRDSNAVDIELLGWFAHAVERALWARVEVPAI